MGPPLEALANAVAARSNRLAVFDVALRQRTGQWHLETRVPIEATIDAFCEHGAFGDADGRVKIPLHEVDSPALTDEYVLVDTTVAQPVFLVFDPVHSGPREISLETFERSYPAWRMRFWTDAYPIDPEPPFLQEFPSAATFDREPQSVSGTDVGQDTFFDRVRSALVAEQETRRSQTRAAFGNLAPTEFISEQGGISGLTAGGRRVDEFGQQVVELDIPAEHELSGADTATLMRETGLAPGDEVVIDSPDADQLPVEAELFDIDTHRLALGIYWDSARGNNAEADFDADSTHSFTVGRLVAGAHFEAIESAIDTVERSEHSRRRYAGAGELSFGTDTPEIADTAALNRYQTSAVSRAAVAEDLVCVHAPPWTGSRRTIFAMIRTAVDANRRVALITPDRVALDTLLQRERNDGRNSLRAAIRAAGIDLVRVDATDKLADEDRTEADVIAAPLERADRLEDHSFDVAIVDQAARIGVPAGAVPFAKASQVILVGDPQQSPRSTRESDLPPSIFEHLRRAYGDDCVEQLRCQYRMNQAIALFPNSEFYDGALIHGQRNRTWSVDTAAPIEVVHVAGRERETPTGSIYNEAEVQAIREEVRDLLDRGLPAEQIGVITPYSAQVGKIRVALDDEEAGLGERVSVGGIDQFRCAHRDAIVLSTVRTRSPAEWAREDHDPFWTDRGVNIAMTRACKRLVLVGDWRTLRARETAIGENDPFARLAAFLGERGLLEGLLD